MPAGVGALLLFGLRANTISEGERFALASREGALVFNNVMLSAILAIVLLGTLYPLLHKMEGQRLIKAKWEDGPSGKARKYYGLTPKGTRLLGQSREQWQTLSGAVDSLLMGAG